MRVFILAGAVAALLLESGPSRATEGPWCAVSRHSSIDPDCSQPSYEMCRLSMAPLNGHCYPNQNYRGATQRPVQAKKRIAR
jgi:hypothetical protein